MCFVVDVAQNMSLSSIVQSQRVIGDVAPGVSQIARGILPSKAELAQIAQQRQASTQQANALNTPAPVSIEAQRNEQDKRAANTKGTSRGSIIPTRTELAQIEQARVQAKAQQTGSTNAPVLGIVQTNAQKSQIAKAKAKGTSQGSIIPSKAELAQVAQQRARAKAQQEYANTSVLGSVVQPTIQNTLAQNTQSTVFVLNPLANALSALEQNTMPVNVSNELAATGTDSVSPFTNDAENGIIGNRGTDLSPNTAQNEAARHEMSKGRSKRETDSVELAENGVGATRIQIKDFISSDIPSIKNGGFSRFYNQLSSNDLDVLWQNLSIREVIEARLRSPGNLHEWHLVSRTPIFKKWGITVEQIKEMRTPIGEINFINPDGKHGGRGSTLAHNELLEIIDSSSDYEAFVRRLNEWANHRLEGGSKALPIKLQR